MFSKIRFLLAFYGRAPKFSSVTLVACQIHKNFKHRFCSAASEPTAPIKMKVYQEPSPPYLEGQIVKLSCSSEAWPSTTKYELEANQIPIYEKTENESLTGIEHQIKIDNAVHGNIECVATNKIGSSRKQFEVTIHG